jgi:predicted MFS family arabinose efflux permease
MPLSRKADIVSGPESRPPPFFRDLMPSKISAIPPGKIRLITVIAISQLAGWGTTFDMPSVLGRAMERDLGMPFDMIFLGLSVMMLMSAFAAPKIGRLLVRFGAIRILSIGSILLASGLALLSCAQGQVSYFAAWLVIGIGGAFALSVPANTAVVEREGSAAKRTIGMTTIFTGLSSAISWPLMTLAETHYGWRLTLLMAAALQLIVILPLHRFGLPPVATKAATAPATSPIMAPPPLSAKAKLQAFMLIAASSSLFGFVGFGIAPSLIEIMKSAGAAPELALTLASMRAVIGISARLGDVLLGDRTSPVSSGLVAIIALLTGYAVLLFFSPSLYAPAIFILLYGIGSGISSLVRSLLPLAFFAPSEFAVLSSRIALPQNIATAIAPAAFAFIMERAGLDGLLWMTTGLSLVTFGCMLGLWRLRARSRSYLVA